MKVIVDTCIWSQAFRRSKKSPGALVRDLKNLILDHRVQMIGPIRQEILSGIRDPEQFNQLKKYLDSFPDHPLESADYIEASRYFNICRSKGIQGSNTDFLICAVAIRNSYSIFTIDKDFARFATQIPIILHHPELP